MPVRRTDLARVPTARRKTNWKAAADGSVWEFAPGVDFDSAASTLATNARHWGSKHGYSVSVAIDDKDHVLVQFRPIVGGEIGSGGTDVGAGAAMIGAVA
jgi:hypothetical protein